ncbi:hypothetical protein D7030_00315 [Flavobacteriaceae bacterium AU392]|nr:hypothetical protein D1817_14120 [Flavobacteriaceae bacterium]RKM86976.1 hypothetical protein D7030_00315 [Flavobacteriaceae bacterium AU392]
MYQLALVFSIFFTLSIANKTNLNEYSISNIEYTDLDTEKRELEKLLFGNFKGFKGEPVKVSDVVVYEIEEELNFIQYSNPNMEYASLDVEKYEIEEKLFGNFKTFEDESVDVNDIIIYEIEEEIPMNYGRLNSKVKKCEKYNTYVHI